MREFTGKMPHPRGTTPVLCELAQSKCTWTCHESQKFTGKIIQRPPGPIQRDAIQLCKGQRQFGYEPATKCIEVAQNGKYWSHSDLE